MFNSKKKRINDLEREVLNKGVMIRNRDILIEHLQNQIKILKRELEDKDLEIESLKNAGFELQKKTTRKPRTKKEK